MSYHDRFSVRNFFLAPWRRPRWATLFITLEEKREQKPRNEADIRLTLQLVLVVDEKKMLFRYTFVCQHQSLNVRAQLSR